MNVNNFTPENLDKFRRLCNFTKDERQYFELRLKNYSNVKIALEMYVSEAQVSKLAKRVKSKITRIINT